MNIPILISGALAILAFFAHAFQGDKEFRDLRPDATSSNAKKQVWIQTRGGWHWVSVDLLFSGILLILISTTNYIEQKIIIAQLLSIYFLITGIVWFLTVFVSKTDNKQIFLIGQWMFCFFLSALIFYGKTNL